MARSMVFRRRLGTDPEAVEAAVDAGLVEAWEAREALGPDEAAFVAYARERVRREVRAADQVARRRDAREALRPPEELPERVAPVGDPELVVAARRALEGLEEAERSALIAWAEGATAAEIGARHGRPSVWGWRLVQRARRRVLERERGLGDGPDGA
ncbi:MAG: sigma-70 family RNA polymerase sigma factor [Deltaproteobacteria bacterium]|nr:sigma-70 family RNA polymerase sigma factor [Deltaproteobacteria bacterium]